MGCGGREGNMGGCLEKFAKVKQTLKKEVFSPWEKNLWNFWFHPGWSSLKFKWISGGPQTSVLALGSVAFPSVLEDCWNWSAKGFFMLMWCTGSPEGWLRRGSAASVSATAMDHFLQSWRRRRSLPIAFLSALPMFPPACSVVRLSVPWTDTGLCAFHTGRKWVCFHFYKQTVQSGPKL